jgi:tetratricopeptide (TPR) repeat protein
MMKPAAVRRLAGFATGGALIVIGLTGVWTSKSDLESPLLQTFCQAGLCAAQFTPERVFQLSQKATLGDASGELEDFRRAVRLSPASAYRWADLAEAEFQAHNDKLAEYAISQALLAGPRSAVILERAANLYFQLGDRDQVVRQLYALLSDPGLAAYFDTAFLTYSRLGLPVEDILKNGVPQNLAVLSNLLSFWTKIGRVDEAVATWRWITQRFNDSKLAESEGTADFFAFLMKPANPAAEHALAQQLWQEYANRREPAYRKRNWIYNPSFEFSPTRSPFDWRIGVRPDVEVTRVQDSASGGAWSLSLRFNGESNIAYNDTYQDMVLEPGRYQFSVLMKTDQVTTDQGVRIHIFDVPEGARLNVWTDDLLATRDWTPITKSFEVPAGVALVRLVIARQTSMKFDSKISGTVWLDKFQLSR